MAERCKCNAEYIHRTMKRLTDMVQRGESGASTVSAGEMAGILLLVAPEAPLVSIGEVGSAVGESGGWQAGDPLALGPEVALPEVERRGLVRLQRPQRCRRERRGPSRWGGQGSPRKCCGGGACPLREAGVGSAPTPPNHPP